MPFSTEFPATKSSFFARNQTNYDFISEGGSILNDDKIIVLIFEKQQTGMEHLREKYRAYARKITLRFLDCPEDAEECINDAFFDVWNAIFIH